MFRVLTCLTTQHDWRIVVIACLVCFVTSLCVVAIFHRARNAQGRGRAIWIAIAGIAAGFGIWATHFIAMLAYDPGIGIAYDIVLTALAFLAAMALTCVGSRLSVPPLAIALGIAVVALMILGMTSVVAAMDRHLRERYQQVAVALNNMSQGLCMYNAAEQLIIFNQRYIEMYGLSKDVVKPG